MKTKRIAAASLTIGLLALLVWMATAGVGDRGAQLTLGIGSLLGLYYTFFGRLPQWVTDYSFGGITEDDDPANISPRVYLPIILGAIAVAAITLVLFLRLR